jgi:hypothetical protein
MPVPDFSPGEVLTAAAMDSIGLWLIGSGSLSLTTTPTNVASVFSSTYRNYRVLFNVTAKSTTNRIDMRYIVGTTPASSLYYMSGIGSDFAANAPVYYQRSNNDAQINGFSTLNIGAMTLDIMNPNTTQQTFVQGNYADLFTGYAFAIGGVQNSTNQFTGFQLFTSTGTATVQYQVFGYRN